jgi:hypothetical protein
MFILKIIKMLINLPLDIIQEVSNFLTIYDQLSLLMTCKMFYNNIYIEHFLLEHKYYSKNFINKNILHQEKYKNLLTLDLSNINFCFRKGDFKKFKNIRKVILPDIRLNMYYGNVFIYKKILEELQNLEILKVTCHRSQLDISRLYNLRELYIRCSSYTNQDVKKLKKIIKYDFDYTSINL